MSLLTPEVLFPALGWGVLLPALVAAAIALPVIWLARLGRPLGTAAIAAGVLTATFALGLVPLQPVLERGSHWLPALTVLAGIVGGFGQHWLIRIGGGLTLAAATSCLLIPATATVPFRTAILIGLPIAVFAITLLDESIREHGRRAILVLALTAACGAVVLERGATASFAQMAGALAAALAGVCFVANRTGIAGGALPINAVLVPGLMACGYFNTFSNVPLASYVAVAAAPLGLFTPLRRWPVVFAVVVLALAVGLAIQAEPFEWGTAEAPGH